MSAITVFAQWVDNGTSLTTSDNVGIGTTIPTSELTIVRSGTSSSEYPTLTTQGNVVESILSGNNTLEIGISRKVNDRRAWILSRNSDLSGSYGMHYSTLHLQPDIGDKSQYRGLAIGYTADLHLYTGTHLAVNGRVGIGTINPTSLIELKSTSAETNAALESENDHNIKSFFYTGRSGITSLINKTIIENGSGYDILLNPSGGNVGIGTTQPNSSYKLSVNGSVRSKEVRVEANWSDFVFGSDYKLRSLEELEEYINENNHLPEIPSEEEVNANGINLGEMNAKLLMKIEELTLYIIEEHKQNQLLQAEIGKLKEMNASLLKSIEH